MTRLGALHAVRELAACSDREISRLLVYADEVHVPAGRRIAERGRRCAAFVVVMEGMLRAGHNLLAPGESYGWGPMWERSENETDVTVDSDARLLVMSHEQFRAVKGLFAEVRSVA